MKIDILRISEFFIGLLVFISIIIALIGFIMLIISLFREREKNSSIKLILIGLAVFVFMVLLNVSLKMIYKNEFIEIRERQNYEKTLPPFTNVHYIE